MTGVRPRDNISLSTSSHESVVICQCGCERFSSDKTILFNPNDNLSHVRARFFVGRDLRYRPYKAAFAFARKRHSSHCWRRGN
jgi:hypothetical protein